MVVLQQTGNPSYGKAVNGWLQDHVWPPSDTTKIDAGVLLPQERDQSGTIHKYLCGRGFFEVLGAYDQSAQRMINTSIKFIVPFFGPITFIEGYTGPIDSDPQVQITVHYGPINGFVALGLYKPKLDANAREKQESHIALTYKLTTPYGELDDTAPLFPADASVSLSSRVWYKNVPLVENSVVESYQARKDSQVERSTRATSNGHVAYATAKILNATDPSKRENVKLLERFLRDFAVKDDDKIIVPATPSPPRLNDQGGIVASVEKQRTIRAQFHNQFRLVGSVNLETLYVNAVLLISIPITGNTQTCQVAGSLTDISGIVLLLNEPLINGMINFGYDDQGSKAYLTVTAKVELALVGPVKLVDFPLVELPPKYTRALS